jgi:MFS family permease
MVRTRARLTSITPEVAALCFTIFLADVVAGIVAPTFSLFARYLGVSLALLGALSTVGGLTQLVISLPVGILSDSVGRSRVLALGLLSFIAALVSFAVATGVPLLATGRILFGLGTVAVFQIGAAYLGDITSPGERSFAFGLYATAMGLGFTVGPLLGSQLAAHSGPRSAYLAGALIALLGLVVARRMPRLATESARPPSSRRRVTLRDIRQTLRQPELLLISFGNMLVSLTFAGAVSTFFPLYGHALLLSQATIGTMFALRALISALGRFPNGLISRWLGSRVVMLGALLLDAAAMFGIARTDRAALLALLLAVEGLAFGAYLVAGQTYVAEHTVVQNRGTAVGLYSVAASLGATVGPFVLGAVADARGVTTVFVVTGWALVGGLLCSVIGTALIGQRARATRPGEMAIIEG